MTNGVGTCETTGNSDGKLSRYTVSHTNGSNSYTAILNADK